ncbi:MAG: hypothetical protein ACFN40_06385 [Bacteroidota bacterium]
MIFLRIGCIGMMHPLFFTLCGVGRSPTDSFAYIDRSRPQIRLNTSYLYN